MLMPKHRHMNFIFIQLQDLKKIKNSSEGGEPRPIHIKTKRGEGGRDKEKQREEEMDAEWRAETERLQTDQR